MLLPRTEWFYPASRGPIEFENVAFSYGEQPVLKEINLTVGAGEKVAVIGLTGSGKSTLINLIPRFYDPNQGRITIDGIDLREIDLALVAAAGGFGVTGDFFVFGHHFR